MASNGAIAAKMATDSKRVRDGLGEGILPTVRHNVPNAVQWNQMNFMEALADVVSPPPLDPELLPRPDTTNTANEAEKAAQ